MRKLQIKWVSRFFSKITFSLQYLVIKWLDHLITAVFPKQHCMSCMVRGFSFIYLQHVHTISNTTCNILHIKDASTCNSSMHRANVTGVLSKECQVLSNRLTDWCMNIYSLTMLTDWCMNIQSTSIIEIAGPITILKSSFKVFLQFGKR